MTCYSGYLAPEYAIHGLYSIKSDVFSFGVLMLEIVSGKKNRGPFLPSHCVNLIGHVSINRRKIFLYYFKLCNLFNFFKIVVGMEVVE